ncbi:MAG: alpha/beta hydrolase fold domain-containing protein [Caulobacterales bacterium]
MANDRRSTRKAALDVIGAHLATPPEVDDLVRAMRTQTERYAMGQAGRGLHACREIDVVIGAVPARWFVPPGAGEGRRHVHLHGGGWTAGSIASHRAMLAELALAMAAPVLAPAYRLAPEHPFPAAFDDAFAALAFAQAHGPLGDAAPARVTLSGDSAGGNLAAAVALRCIAEKAQAPERLALISPFLALKLGGSSFAAPVQDIIVMQEGIDLVGTLYAPHTAPRDPRVEPLYAERTDLARMCPVLIQASAVESLRDQAFAFANALWAAGAEARLSLWPDVPHVWHVFLETLPDASAAIGEVAAFLTAP